MLGIDDWARKRGQSYASVLVDMGDHRIIRGAHPAMFGAFTLLSIDLGEAAVSEYAYVENRAGSLLMDKVPEVQTHRLAFDSLRAEALDSKESIALIEQAANELG